MPDEPEILEPGGGQPASGSPERSRREPPTIDLDASAVSGETPKETDAGHGKAETSGRRWPGAIHLALSMVSGAVGAALLIAGLSFMGLIKDTSGFKPPPAASAADITARLTRLEKMAEAPPSAAEKPDPLLPARIATLEQSSQTQRETIATLRRQIDTLSAALSEVKAAPVVPAAPAAPAPPAASESPSAVEPAADLKPLADKIAGLEATVERLEREVPAAPPAPVELPKTLPDLAARHALVASILAREVQIGVPYAGTLALARHFGELAPMLAPLAPFADRGVPSAGDLCRDLLALLPRTTGAPAKGETVDKGLWAQLRARAKELVRIEPVGNGMKARATEAFAAVEQAAQRNDLAAARKALEKIPEADRAFAKDWLITAGHRDMALSASRSLLAAALKPIGDVAQDER